MNLLGMAKTSIREWNNRFEAVGHTLKRRPGGKMLAIRDLCL
jgi:hypothetical protein